MPKKVSERPKPIPAYKNSKRTSEPKLTNHVSGDSPHDNVQTINDPAGVSGPKQPPPFNAKYIPLRCPSSYCRNLVPVPASDTLVALFKERRELEIVRYFGIQEAGDDELVPLLPISKFELTICTQIKLEIQQERYAGIAIEFGWPVTLDFTVLPSRIFGLRSELDGLFFDAEQLNPSVVWETLMEDVAFGSKDPKEELMKFVKDANLQRESGASTRPG